MLKIFLIEDALRIRSLLIEVLQSTGKIEVVGYADNEREALCQLRAIEWDIAIVDIALPEGSGLSILDALKKDGRNYGARLVLTNNPSLALKARSIALGATAFFDKSCEIDELVNYLQSISA